MRSVLNVIIGTYNPFKPEDWKVVSTELSHAVLPNVELKPNDNIDEKLKEVHKKYVDYNICWAVFKLLDVIIDNDCVNVYYGVVVPNDNIVGGTLLDGLYWVNENEKNIIQKNFIIHF